MSILLCSFWQEGRVVMLLNTAMAWNVQVKLYSLASETSCACSTSAIPHHTYLVALGVDWHLRKCIDLLYILHSHQQTACNRCKVPWGGVQVECMYGDKSIWVGMQLIQGKSPTLDSCRQVGWLAGGVGVAHLWQEGYMGAHVNEGNGYVWLVGHIHTDCIPSALPPLNPKIERGLSISPW